MQPQLKEPQSTSSIGTVEQDKSSTRSLSPVGEKRVPRSRRQSRDANRSFDKRRSLDRKTRPDVGVGHSTMGSEELEKVTPLQMALACRSQNPSIGTAILTGRLLIITTIGPAQSSNLDRTLTEKTAMLTLHLSN